MADTVSTPHCKTVRNWNETDLARSGKCYPSGAHPTHYKQEVDRTQYWFWNTKVLVDRNIRFPRVD